MACECWTAVRMGVRTEHRDTIRTCVLTSESGHTWQRVVTGQPRWLSGQHLGLALTALELRLLLLFRFRSSSQHVGFSFF
jgi:hypothetical protein